MPPQGQVTFNEEQFTQRRTQSVLGGISSWLIQKGIVKDEKGANTFMIVTASVAVLIATVTPFILTGGKEEPLSPADIQRIEAFHTNLRPSR